MNVQIGNNVEHVTIADIRPEYEGATDFCTTTLQLNVEGIRTNIVATIMLDEMQQLLTDLNKVYDTLQHSFTFVSLEEHVKIEFTPSPSGHIILKGCLRTSDYNSKVEFEITTDQTFLPVTISQLKETINELTS